MIKIYKTFFELWATDIDGCGIEAPPQYQSGGSVVMGTFGQIDNLAYIYNTKNQVTTITDGANASKGFKGSSSAYTYDANGNLKTDVAKGITNIVYNYLNLPQTIEFSYHRRIEFVYDATGVKLRKTVIAPLVADVVTDYMDGFEYKNGTLEKMYHTEGYVERKADGAFQYNYTLKDHLGNTRVTFADLNNSGTIDPNTEINQINHYAPFGLNLEGNWNGASAEAKNKYQYNGKELQTDFDLNWNDYGARFYDGGRNQWTTIDPLTEKHRAWTGYNYVLNNPIKFIDLDGRDTTQRKQALVKAQEYKDNNPTPNKSMYVMGAKGEPGDPVDCSGMVSQCVKAGEEKNPNRGNKTSGVLNIESNTKEVVLKDVQEGNLVTFRNTKKGSYLYHIGIVKTVEKDANGNPTKVTMIHSSGGKGPNELSFNPNSAFAWGQVKVNGYYKWDSRPDPVRPVIPIVMPSIDVPRDALNLILINH